MANVHHKPIKRFSLDGNIHDDSAIARLRCSLHKKSIVHKKKSKCHSKCQYRCLLSQSLSKSHHCFSGSKESIIGIHLNGKQQWYTLILQPERSMLKMSTYLPILVFTVCINTHKCIYPLLPLFWFIYPISL